MDPYNSKLRKLQEAWSGMDEGNDAKKYVDHIRNNVDLIKQYVTAFLSHKIKERVAQEPRRTQRKLQQKLEKNVGIAEIGVYGSAVTGDYKTYPDRPGDIDVFVRLTTAVFFNAPDWWNGTEWAKLQDELALGEIPVDVAIIGKHESHKDYEDREDVGSDRVVTVYP